MGNSPSNWYEGTPYLSKWIVLENSSIKGAKDLVGKKIAVNNVGAHVDYVTREYLAGSGLSPNDMQFVQIPIPEFIIHLIVSACSTSLPFSQRRLPSIQPPL